MVKYINMFILLLIIAYSSSAQDRQTPTLVSPAWLSEHLNDPNLILIQVCRFRQEYTKAHIPSARFLWFEYISPNNPDESVGLPSVEQAKNTLQELGVSNDSHIILYSGPKVIAYVMRTFLILEYLGLASNVSIVNGGLDAWKAAGKPLSQEITHVTKCGNLTLKPNPHIILYRS
jgi:thiosulfate/3-mercaptopyruvate sulfurtransferase